MRAIEAGLLALTVVLAALSAGTSRAAEVDPALPPEAARLDAALAGVKGLRVDFVQIRSVTLTGEEIQAQGTFAFRPPREFHMRYEMPEPQELAIVGDSLWVLPPSENQAQRYPYQEGAPGSEIFLLFGGRRESLAEAFEIEQGPWGSYEQALLLVPRNQEPGYPIEEIRVVVGESGFPERLFFREVTGDTVVFRFMKVVQNPADLEELIRFELPEGIEVIEGGPTRQGEGLPIDK